MTEQRPDPDKLLARIKADEQQRQRGRLKIFLGMAPGVGKTFAMLEAARRLRDGGSDVVIGVVESHRRAETGALLEGLEILPRLPIDYRGHQLYEFDLDAALKRKPALLLVDELAHSNATGCRHAKRWQDVEELLDAGIDVYTTVNIQHLESVNDLVGQITGIRVQETFPDHVFEAADDVELVDLPPDELLLRLEQGKVYLGEQAALARKNFFRKGNLIALRELTLRRMAERVDAQLRAYRDRHDIQHIWAVNDRLMVLVGPHSNGEQLVRAGKRMANALNAEWIVVYVETPKYQNLSAQAREVVLRTLALAEKLGAETVTLAGPLISAEVLGYAQTRNVTRLLVGKPTTPAWRRWLLGSAVDELIRHAHNLDVYIIGSEAQAEHSAGETHRASSGLFARSPAYAVLAAEVERKRRWRQRLAMGMIIPALSTLLAWSIHSHVANANLIMIYLLGVVITATRYGRAPAVLASILSVAAFDFFFVAPSLTFAVSDTQYLITFAVMLVVALIISRLASGLRLQAQIAGYRERRMSELFSMSRELAVADDIRAVKAIAMRHVNEVFAARSAVLQPDAQARLQYEGDADGLAISAQDMGVAQWVHDHEQIAGHGTATLPAAEALFLPLSGASGCIGVLAVQVQDWERLRNPEQRRQLETFASQIALAIERVSLARQTEQARMAIESERLRNSLLAAISHDLRTPLATIVGAASQLSRVTAASGGNAELVHSIRDEALRMTELIGKVLDMARLESGNPALECEWVMFEEVIGAVLHGLRHKLAGYQVRVQVNADVGLVYVDVLLMERVLHNLLENAAKYTPAGSLIGVQVWRTDAAVQVRIADNGPGLPQGMEESVFEKFFRANPESHSPGVGLGLTICRAIVGLHGGQIRARRGEQGGAVFEFELPQRGSAPGADSETENLA